MASEVRARSRRGSGANGVRPQRRLFTVDEYERLIAADIVHEGEPVELIAGEIVRMAALGPRHSARVNGIQELFTIVLPPFASIRIQSPIRLPPQFEPEPDIAIVRRRPDRYRNAHPGPADVFLVIEVSDTSLRSDRNVKLQLYAAAGIREVWIVDLVGSRVLVGRSPAADGYAELTEVGLDGVLTPLAFPDITLTVEEMLG